MTNKPKIRISKDAYKYFMDLLEFHTEYDCIYISKNSKSCCKSSKADITLDCSSGKDVIDIIDELTVTYDSDLYLDFSEITIALLKTGIYIKTSPAEGIILSGKKSCNSKK